jgi:16S rRNA G966 N2-methylase RsmD
MAMCDKTGPFHPRKRRLRPTRNRMREGLFLIPRASVQMLLSLGSRRIPATGKRWLSQLAGDLGEHFVERAS